MSTRRCAKRAAAFDVAAIRRDFPILSTKVHGKPLVYLDNAASTQKPARRDRRRARRLRAVQRQHPPRRALALGERDRRLRGRAREGPRASSTPPSAKEIVFVRGTTEAINLVAQTLRPAAASAAGDEVLITAMEHHSNIVPWQMLCEEKGATAASWRRSTTTASSTSTALERLLDAAHADRRRRPRLERARHDQSRRAIVAARARAAASRCSSTAPRPCRTCRSTCSALDCDFYAFSGHKMYGPTGIGVLYGRAELLEAMPPYQGGGDMIRVGHLREDHLQRAALQVRGRHAEHRRRRSASAPRSTTSTAHRPRRDRGATSTTCSPTPRERSATIPGVRIIGTAREKAGVLSFVLDGVHPHDIGTMLDREGVADAHRPPLRAAGHGALRRAGDRARLVRALQHARRGRRARGRRSTRCMRMFRA